MREEYAKLVIHGIFYFSGFCERGCVSGKDACTGSLSAALTEAGFLTELEKNSNIVEMANCAPLLVNHNDRRWTLDAIAFNSSKHYGNPNYWVPKFFIELRGATLFDAKLQTNFSTLIASAITLQNSNGETYLKLKTRIMKHWLALIKCTRFYLTSPWEIQAPSVIKTQLLMRK
ncbi:alpha-L-arabinofuranosidase 1-like isoform X2 [Populus nigra]|uniref:alpha-L-arabinofuranosidase 1-like isoform X2 n=1 Tax=Populus nigra TaxID=3691 RepID=UPI002B26B07E|nr:alpha-L-arabinofuranosidase 1-like isoform X2 [Populus nigra]